jgi:hypothetical protein
MIAAASYGWAGDVATFLATPQEEVMQALTAFVRERGSPQLFAWDRSLITLREQLNDCMPSVAPFALILEYEIPRGGGRRPDLIVLQNGIVLVVEFKNRVLAEQPDIDQVKAYVRDLEQYHSASQRRTLLPVLVSIGMDGEIEERDGVRIVPARRLGSLIRELLRQEYHARPDARAWAEAKYDPLPALVEAARLIFERQPLPRVRTAESARIPETVEHIEHVVRETRARRGRSLVLLTGVPGSGKTLVGLQLVHSRALGVPAVFLTGNGPLAQVLKYSLKSGVFVVEIRRYLHEHHIRSKSVPHEAVIVFDEAQRAWDRDRVIEKHGGRMIGSEPQLLLSAAARSTEGSVVVALLGEGQEIHAGEEAGFSQWVEAAGGVSPWEVHGPPHLARMFQAAGIEYYGHDLLNLTTSLRSHRAGDVASWTSALLDGDVAGAKSLARRLHEYGYVMYVSRNLAALREYVSERFVNEPARRYGLITSSKFRRTGDYDFEPASNRFYYYGQWYEAERRDLRSCCQLQLAVTEFGCQGLELDLPVLCWGPDLRWDGTKWQSHVGRARKVKNPHQIRINAYRVLLTRGREGLCVFVPRVPDGALDRTFEALLDAGCLALPE